MLRSAVIKGQVKKSVTDECSQSSSCECFCRRCSEATLNCLVALENDSRDKCPKEFENTLPVSQIPSALVPTTLGSNPHSTLYTPCCGWHENQDQTRTISSGRTNSWKLSLLPTPERSSPLWLPTIKREGTGRETKRCNVNWYICPTCRWMASLDWSPH
jgi:hypothetical protein